MSDIKLLAKLASNIVGNNDVLTKLLAAKKHSDVGNYELKNRILKELMQQSPDEWLVDDPKPKYKGVTHLPTKFKLHADPRIIDSRVSVADLAKQAALFKSSFVRHNPGMPTPEEMNRLARPMIDGTNTQFHQPMSLMLDYRKEEQNKMTPVANVAPPAVRQPQQNNNPTFSMNLMGTGQSRPTYVPPAPAPTNVAKNVPAVAKQAALKDEVKLQEHQQRIIDRMNAGDNRLLLYHGLGSGKSLSSLAAAEAAGGDYAAVTPASLRQNYEKEIEKFTEGSNPDVLSYTGIGAGKTPANIPNTVIFDEAHRLRNPNTASARAARNLAGQAKNLLVLTGTPITNEPSDLASLLGILHGKNITPQQFDEQFVGHKKVYPSWMSWLTNRNPGEEVFVKNEDKLREMLKGKIDYQPSKTPEGVNVKEEIVKTPLSSQQERIQHAIKSQIPPEWAWKLNKEFPLSRDELKSLNSFLTGLRQSSLSTLPFREDKDPLTAFKQSSKLQKAYQDLQQELRSDPRKKAIVYSNYIGAGIDPYAAALKANNVPYGVFHGGIPLKQRKQTLQDYNEGKLRALLLGPAAAEGISTKGTNLIQLLDPHWHESRLNQARGRGLRFDSHTGLPEDLKNVAVKRYISESKEPSLLGWLMGYKRQRTGDEILQSLAANKEKANELFRNILKEEGSPKQANDGTMEKTLQNLLANCTDLALLFKHCHWNAIGKMFKPLHDFLDEVHETLVETSDDIAERMVALDYPASGLISQIAAQSAMSALPLKFLPAETIVDELTTRLGKLTGMFNSAIKETESDPVTSNMLQDMTHKLEKHLWMLRRQKGNSVEVQKVAAIRALNQLFN